MKEKLDKLLKLELNELDKLDLEKELSNLKLTSHKIYQEYLLEKHENCEKILEIKNNNKRLSKIHYLYSLVKRIEDKREKERIELQRKMLRDFNNYQGEPK
ncbi:hypothetical protein DR8_02530 [Helicobacter pylori]|uniref:hypothetical protein n=1 Tax=Helicobacter pylori TaxID=210 RepID=UPI0002BB1F2A|nr:hypothetical protein [Helicobacter pylori]EMG90852.1 hypothetical protein HMPREF1403_00666 [Helicobacter pylori GAM201Ai]WRF34347.1 hypothetical protein KVE76_00945 [Helicobacter pylori]